MSIIPAGKRREQVAQGPLKNQSILDSVLFEKVAITPGVLGDDSKKQNNPNQAAPPGQGAPSDVGNALMQGGLDAPGQADQHEQQFDPMNQAPPSPQGIDPAGGPGESPFLQPPDPTDGQQQSSPVLQQMEQVEKVLQGSGFKMSLREKGSGKWTIQLQPVRPMQRENYKRILQGLQDLGFSPTGADLPGEPISNDPVYMEYTLGTGEEKVMKPGK